ncbi:hypothetical protein DVS77_19010 [Mycolicibacterium moriokaense]|nr:hypothetical protein DVS77_19010 [Mycolicibacterium moriokaense]
MTQTPNERLFIVEATNWKEAVITLLERNSSYTPWRYGGGEAEEGDAVAFVLSTEPTSVLTALGRIGADGDPTQARVEPSPAPLGLADLDTLVMMTTFRYDSDPRHEWVLDGEMAIRMRLALEECGYRDDQYMRFGHSPLAAARILLRSCGRCSGCDRAMDLDLDSARDEIHIHTVDAYQRDRPSAETDADWPGALCERCTARMRKDGYTSLVDYRLAQHPACPKCGAQRTLDTLFGMLMTRDVPPWRDVRGCCVTFDDWTCGECGHTW